LLISENLTLINNLTNLPNNFTTESSVYALKGIILSEAYIYGKNVEM
jgi:hypothetical protein